MSLAAQAANTTPNWLTYATAAVAFGALITSIVALVVQILIHRATGRRASLQVAEARIEGYNALIMIVVNRGRLEFAIGAGGCEGAAPPYRSVDPELNETYFAKAWNAPDKWVLRKPTAHTI